MTLSLLIVYLMVFISFIIARPLTTMIHELGHGIPALFLTKGKVTLYIGSYGNKENSINFTLGRLEIYFRYNLLLWTSGVCMSSERTRSLNHDIIIVLGGPINSLLFGFISFYLSLKLDFHGGIKWICLIFLVSSVLDFFNNVIPNNSPIHLHDGTISYNDGQHLTNLLRYKKLPDNYTLGVEYYNNSKYKAAAEEFQSILESGIMDKELLNLLFSCYWEIQEYQQAASIMDIIGNNYKQNSNDYCNSGLVKSHFEDYEASLIDFKKSLELNPYNTITLNNRGYTYNLIKQYKAAILDFDLTIELEPNFAYSYNNRGLSKIKLGDLKQGLEDIETGLKLDKTNGYGFRNKDIYFYDKQEYDAALIEFKKAAQTGKNVHLLEEYIRLTEEKLKQ